MFWICVSSSNNSQEMYQKQDVVILIDNVNVNRRI